MLSQRIPSKAKSFPTAPLPVLEAGLLGMTVRPKNPRSQIIDYTACSLASSAKAQISFRRLETHVANKQILHSLSLEAQVV